MNAHNSKHKESSHKETSKKESDEEVSGFEIYKHTLLYVIIIFLLPFLTHFLGAYIVALAESFGHQGVIDFIHLNEWSTGLIAYSAYYLFTLFYLSVSLNSLKSYGYVWKNDFVKLACVIGIISGVIMYFIDGATNPGLLQMPAFSMTTFVGILVGAIILPALFEETLFRGVIQGFYQKVSSRNVKIFSWEVPLAVFIASAFEIAFHLVFPLYFFFFSPNIGAVILITVPQLIYVGVFGAIGGYFYYRTGSLLTPIIIHALGNLTEYVLAWFF